MSSVVNKSKNKFAPKAKARPRPGAAAAATPAPQDPVVAVAAAPAPPASQLVEEPSEPSQSQNEATHPLKAPVTHTRAPIHQSENQSSAGHDPSQEPLDELPSSEIPAIRVTENVTPETQTSRPGENLEILTLDGNNWENLLVPPPPSELPTVRSSVSRPQAQPTKIVIPKTLAAFEDPEHTVGVAENDIVVETMGGEHAVVEGSSQNEDDRGVIEEGAIGRETEKTSAIDSNQGEKSVAGRKPGAGTTTARNPTLKRKAPASISTAARSKRAKTHNQGHEEDLDQDVDSDSDIGADTEVEIENDVEVSENPPAKKKPPRKPRQSRITKKPVNGEVVEGVEDGAENPASKPKSALARKRAARKSTGTPGSRKRAETPEHGETQEIEPNIVKMKDLCHDIRIGKKSKRFVEIKQMEIAKRAKDQRGATADAETPRSDEEDIGSETVEERLERLANVKSGKRRVLGAPQMRIVDGQIVIDEESLQIDRHQRDGQNEEILEIVEENQHTRLVNSHTWGKRVKVEKWDQEATSRFYETLSMFGTDFEVISRMFPGRTRRQLKNKYTSEERKHPEKITMALRTRVEVDLDKYSEISEIQFPDPQILQDELDNISAAHLEEEEAANTHAATMEKERQARANEAMQNGDNQDAGAAESGKKTRKKKVKGKAPARQGEEEIMGIEEYEAQRARELAEADG